MIIIIPIPHRVYPNLALFLHRVYPNLALFLSHVAARLKGEFRQIARICASCSLRQMVSAVLLVWSCAVKDSSAAFAYEGDGYLSSSRLNAASVDLLLFARTPGRMIKWALEVCTQHQKLADTDNTNAVLHCSHHDGDETDNSSNLEVLDNLDYGRELEEEFGVLGRDILYQQYQYLGPRYCAWHWKTNWNIVILVYASF